MKTLKTNQMSRRNDNNPINENWVKMETKLSWHLTAKQVLEKVKSYRSQFKEVVIPDPNNPRCYICKLIK